MQHCGKCGNYNLDESIFCNQCGGRLNYNCQFCHFPNLPGQEFCGGCHKQLSETEIPRSTPIEAAVEKAAPPPEVINPLPAPSPVASPQPPPVSPPPAPHKTELALEPTVAPHGLEQYALLSIEITNWDQLKAAISPEQLEQAFKQWLRDIEQQLHRQDGQLQVSKNRILFLTFKREDSLDASLQKAIQFFLKQPVNPNANTRLAFKAGLDIEKANARDPLTSTIERSMSLPGALTVSETVYQRIQDKYRVEVVGPVPMGNRTLQFYRILSEGKQLPETETVLNVQPEAATGEQRKTEPQKPAFQQPSVAEAPKAAPPSRQPSASSSATTLPKYQAPVLGTYKDARSPNLTYSQSIDALGTELSAFVAQGKMAKGKISILCAEDGLGKSNILQMARAKVDPENNRAIWLGASNYRCFKKQEFSLYFWIELLQNMLSLVFEGQEQTQVKAQIEKFLTFIYEGQLPEDEAEFLFDLLLVNAPEPLANELQQLQGRVEFFFLHFLKDLCQKQPVILVFEDLPFADTCSLELLSHLLSQGLLDAPIYLIVTQTPQFYTAGSLATALQKVPHKEMVVSPLSDTEAEQFLNDGPLGGNLQAFPSEFIDNILRRAQGLPLYLEEALRLFHLKNILTVDEQTHKFTLSSSYSAEELLLPDDIQTVIRQRVELLDEQTRYILQLASILGERFSVSLLMTLSQLPEEAFNETLETLFNHGYLIPDAVNTGRFRHGTIWQVLYQSLGADLKSQMHQLVSEALENDLQQGLTVNPMLIAYHSEAGGLITRALHYWNLAGLFSGRVGALTGLMLAFCHALDLMKAQSIALESDEMALRIAETLGAAILQKDPEMATQWLEWALASRYKDKDASKLIEPLGSLAAAYEYQGDFPKALASLDKALELLDPLRHPLESISLQVNKLEQMVVMGRYQEARTLMNTAIEPQVGPQGQHHQNLIDTYLHARLLYSRILVEQCDTACLDYIDVTYKLASEQGLAAFTIALQLTQTHYLLRKGQYEVCNREADVLLQHIEQMEESNWFLAQWGLLAMAYHLELEDWDSASQLMLTVISKSEESKDYPSLVLAQLYSGYVYGKLGNIKEARNMLEKGLQQASDYRLAGAALLGWRLLADFELSLGNQEVAQELTSKALDIAQKPEIENQYEILKLSLLHAETLLAQNKLKAAGLMLEPLWKQTVQTKLRPLIATCATGIGQLYKQMAQDAPADLSKKHLMRSVEFFLKAKGIWLELRHLQNVKRVDAAVPRI